MPTRRSVLRGTLAAGGATLLAGCGGEEGEGDGPVPGFEPEGPMLSVAVPKPQDGVQLNPYALNQRGRAVVGPLQQLVLPAVGPTGAFRTSGHTGTVDGTEVSVPTAVADYAVDADGVTTTFESGLSYWNGDALDGRAYFLANRVNWLAFQDFGAEFPDELVSDTEYRRSVETDTWAELRAAVHPGPPPLPPSFTEEWVDRFENASSRAARDDVYTELNATDVDLGTFVTEGYGSGAYRVESEDDVARLGAGARRREDHPGDAAVPNLLVRTPRPAALASIVEAGDADVGTGHVAAQGGDFQRDAVPEAVQQLSRYPSPVDGGFALAFNWENSHLERLWVRRALAAALPAGRVLANAAGQRARPVETHSGLLPELGRTRLGADAVDALVDYPATADAETASEWLERAGYSREGEAGQWHDPDGEPVALALVAGSPAGSAANTVASSLEEFGIAVDLRSLSVTPTNQFEIAVEEGQFDLVVGPTPSGLSAADHYGATPAIRRGTLVAPPLAVGGATLGTCDVGTEWFSPPETVTVPDEPGLTIDGVDYADGGTAYRHEAGTDVDLCAAIETVRAPTASVEERRAAARECARWYNYALPTFVFGASRRAVFGNVERFAFPEADAGRHTAKLPGWSPANYHVQAGTVR